MITNKQKQTTSIFTRTIQFQEMKKMYLISLSE